MSCLAQWPYATTFSPGSLLPGNPNARELPRPTPAKRKVKHKGRKPEKQLPALCDTQDQDRSAHPGGRRQGAAGQDAREMAAVVGRGAQVVWRVRARVGAGCGGRER